MIIQTLLGEDIDMTVEIWKRHTTYGSNRTGATCIVSDFEISNWGNLKPGGIFNKKPAKIHILEDGRRSLSNNRKHCIFKYVDLLFNGPKPKGYVVHHIDFSKDNDRLDNLQRMTISHHMHIHASINNCGGLKSGTRKSITNGIESRYIPIDCEIPKGWWRGRTTNANNQYTKIK